MTMPKRLAILVAGGAACVLNCGCAPPLPVIPATPKKVGYGGEVRSVDLAFLRSGSATRQEVQAQLGWSDVGLNRPSVFWGRWRSSSFCSSWLTALASSPSTSALRPKNANARREAKCKKRWLKQGGDS